MQLLFSLLIACLVTTSALAQAPRPGATYAPPGDDGRVIYRGATLIDGTGAQPRADMAVITRGETIEAVLPASQLSPAVAGSAQVVDLRGKYLLPGLIDSHQHLATPPNRARAEALLRRQLYSGVTAVRIMADDLRSIAELARSARVGEIPAPDLFFAAVVAGPSFFEDPRTQAISAGWTPGATPWAQAIDSETDIPLAIARARGTGATALKIYANLAPPLVQALTAEAHRQGMQVWAHGMVFPTPPAEVIAAGPDVISHACYLAYQVSDKRPQTYQQRFPVDREAVQAGDNRVMADLFQEMRRRGIVLDPTLYVYEAVERSADGSGREPYCTLDLAARLTDQARGQGVLISAGTDGEAPATASHPAIYDEIELLVARAGFSPLEAIRSATMIGAMASGEADRMGSVTAGKIANLLVVSANPLEDIANLRQTLFTVKRGRRFDRADYTPISRQEIPDNDE